MGMSRFSVPLCWPEPHHLHFDPKRTHNRNVSAVPSLPNSAVRGVANPPPALSSAKEELDLLEEPLCSRLMLEEEMVLAL